MYANRISHYRKTGNIHETAQAHLLGTDEEGRRVFQRVEGWEPVTNLNCPVVCEVDADGNWVEVLTAE